jgi:hypothetical protein
MEVLVRAACEAREAEKAVHADLEAVDAQGARTCVAHLVFAAYNVKEHHLEDV